MDTMGYGRVEAGASIQSPIYIMMKRLGRLSRSQVRSMARAEHGGSTLQMLKGTRADSPIPLSTRAPRDHARQGKTCL